MKVVPKKEREHNFPDESVCNICGDEEAENLNAIVFCDGCNVAVHQGEFFKLRARGFTLLAWPN